MFMRVYAKTTIKKATYTTAKIPADQGLSGGPVHPVATPLIVLCATELLPSCAVPS